MPNLNPLRLPFTNVHTHTHPPQHTHMYMYMFPSAFEVLSLLAGSTAVVPVLSRALEMTTAVHSTGLVTWATRVAAILAHASDLAGLGADTTAFTTYFLAVSGYHALVDAATVRHPPPHCPTPGHTQ